MLSQKVTLNTKNILILVSVFVFIVVIFLIVYFLFIEKSLDPRGHTEDEQCYPSPGPQGTLDCEVIDHQTIELTYSYENAQILCQEHEPIRIEERISGDDVTITWKQLLEPPVNSGGIKTIQRTGLTPDTLYNYSLRIGSTPHLRTLRTDSCKTLLEAEEPECGELARKFSAEDISWPSENFCTKGEAKPQNPAFPSAGNNITWECLIDTKSVSCTAERAPRGTSVVCGMLAKTYDVNETSWPTTGTFCSQGEPEPLRPLFPNLGSTTTWKCSDDESSVTCSANRNPALSNCGILARNYEPSENSWPTTGAFCNEGEVRPANPSFPAQGNSTSWECVGASNTATCSAQRGVLPETGSFSYFVIIIGALFSILGFLIYAGKIGFLDSLLASTLNLSFVKNRLMTKKEYFEEKILEKEEIKNK